MRASAFRSAQVGWSLLPWLVKSSPALISGACWRKSRRSPSSGVGSEELCARSDTSRAFATGVLLWHEQSDRAPF